MRILQVSPYFSPRLGGSPQVVYNISRMLSQRGHEVTVLAGDFGLKQAKFPDQAFRTKYLRSVLSRWGFYFTPAIISWCQRHIHEYDIIHLHEVRTFQNMIVHWFAKSKKIPYVLSAHGTLPIVVQRHLLKKIFDQLAGRSILTSAQYFIAVASTEAEQYMQFGIDHDQIRIINNGLNLDEFINLPTPGTFRNSLPGLEQSAKVILYLGRIHMRKGINLIIEALAYLHVNAGKPALVIVGPDDGELSKLISLTKKLHLQSRVLFPGPRYGRERLAAMVDADVMVSPAVHEIFGLAAFEALMCGTPVIVADDCGQGKLIQDLQAGYLVPHGNVAALAEVIEDVFEHPEIAQQKVTAGQKYIRENLNWQTLVNDLESLYLELI